MMAPCGIEIKVGQVWEELDPRVERNNLRVMELLPDAHNGDGSTGKIRIAPMGIDSLSTKAKLDRFHGNRGGYRLVKEAPDGRTA